MTWLDENGYPTEETIMRIERWNGKNVVDFVEFIKEVWHWLDWGFELKGKRVLRLELHTGGWSGNEDIICALSNNIFWMMYWEKSTRGGHYYFKIKL